MKTILIVFIFFSFAVSAQDIPKNANVIIVKNVSFQEAASQLLGKGFLIDKSDEALQYIQTKQKQTKSFWICFVTMQVRIKDSSAIITGTCTDNQEITLSGVSMKPTEYPASWKGEKIGLYKLAFTEMNNFALSFNKPVEYLIQ